MMNDMVISTTNSIYIWFSSMVSKANRIFCAIGYARTAAELARQGYYEEARKCMTEVTILKSKES